MGTEEHNTVTYAGFVYDMCLVRYRLAKIVDDLEDDALAFPDIPAENLRRVIVFLDNRLEERGVYSGTLSEAPDLSRFRPPTQETMGS